MPYRSPARWLGPLALFAVFIATWSILTSGGGSDEGGEVRAPAATTTQTTKPEKKSDRARTYTVKSGDVLSVIAESNDISIEELQRLNPDVDAQSLRPGQRLKLEP